MAVETKAGNPPATGQTSQETESKAAIQKAVSDALTEAGREHKAELDRLASERDTTLKSNLAEKDQAITDLENEISDLRKDDVDYLKLREQKKAEIKTLKAEQTRVTLRETALAERETKAAKFERDRLIGEIAATYVTASGEAASPESLQKAADKFKVNDAEGLKALAEEKGWKSQAKAEPEEEDTFDSGRTSGGIGDPRSAKTMEEYANHPSVKKRFGGK